MDKPERVCPHRKQVAHREGNHIVNGCCTDCGTYVGGGSGRRARPHHFPSGSRAFLAQTNNYQGGGWVG